MTARAIPTRRSVLSRLWAAVQIEWLTWRRDCIYDELYAYRDGGVILGQQYLDNCFAQIEAYDARIAVLEVLR